MQYIKNLAITILAILPVVAFLSLFIAPEWSARQVNRVDDQFFGNVSWSFAVTGGKLTLTREAQQQEAANADAALLELRDRLAALEDAAFAPPVATLPPPVMEPGAEPGAEPAEVPGEEPLIEPAPATAPPPAPQDVARWVVLAGAERNLEGQQRELRLLREAGVADSAVLRIGTLFRAAAFYPTRDDAFAAVPEIEAIVGAQRAPYPRALAAICPAWPTIALPLPLSGQQTVIYCDD